MDVFSLYFAVPDPFGWSKLLQLALPGYIVKQFTVTLFTLVFKCSRDIECAAGTLKDEGFCL